MPRYFFLPTLVQCQETEVVFCCKLYEWRCSLSVSTLVAKFMENLHLMCLINCQLGVAVNDLQFWIQKKNNTHSFYHMQTTRNVTVIMFE